MESMFLRNIRWYLISKMKMPTVLKKKSPDNAGKYFMQNGISSIPNSRVLLLSYMILSVTLNREARSRGPSLQFTWSKWSSCSEDSSHGVPTFQMNLGRELSWRLNMVKQEMFVLCTLHGSQNYVCYFTNKILHYTTIKKLTQQQSKAIQPCSEMPKSLQWLGQAGRVCKTQTTRGRPHLCRQESILRQ